MGKNRKNNKNHRKNNQSRAHKKSRLITYMTNPSSLIHVGYKAVKGASTIEEARELVRKRDKDAIEQFVKAIYRAHFHDAFRTDLLTGEQQTRLSVG